MVGPQVIASNELIDTQAQEDYPINIETWFDIWEK